MRNTRLLLIVLIGSIVIFSCNDSADKAAGNAKDTSLTEKQVTDSIRMGYTTCHDQFFKNLPRFRDSTSAYLVMQNGEKKSLTQFFTDEFMSNNSQYGRKDLDGDGIEELIIFNYTGGAHCCDEYFIFSRITDAEYRYAAHLMGGQGCIDPATNTISFSFGELLGYFYSCYACGLNDSTFKPMRDIQLKYAGAKLAVVPYDKPSETLNINNLERLNKMGFQPMEDMMDNGWRKEFAMNTAVWHYNHGQDWQKTKAIFDRYYKFEDAGTVWKEFHRSLSESKKENSF